MGHFVCVYAKTNYIPEEVCKKKLTFQINCVGSYLSIYT